MEHVNETLESEDAQKNKYLIFSIGKESYGISIKYVTEIIKMVAITKVPELPDYAKGIINLRGKIITVMDARLKFKKEEKDYDDRTCIIVMEINNTSFGFIVDSVNEVANIDEDQIAPPSINIKQETENGIIEGIGKINDEMLLIIDCQKLLNNQET